MVSELVMDKVEHVGAPREVDALILGAGLCGMSAALGLQREGIDRYVIIERSDEFGGTWHHNRYPGCAVDIPSHLYSFSFAPSAEWSRVFAPQAEVKDYLEKLAADHGLAAKTRFGVELLEARWIEDRAKWEIDTTDGMYRARFLILAAGPLHEPIIPNLPGLDDFGGEKFHSAHWPADAELAGKRVVVLGTGASALQFIPHVQKVAKSLTVLQRTPAWVMPKMDWQISRFEKRLLRTFPFLTKVARWALWLPMDVFLIAATRSPRFARATSIIARLHLRRHIKDPQRRRDLTPTYAPTCKRLGLSNDYLRAMGQANVDLVTSGAAAVTASGVETVDGRSIDADVIIFGTGFHTLQRHPINRRVHGIGGRTLDDVWDGSPRAYLGTSVAGFPNAFTMFGPNIGTLSGFVMAEAQTDYLTAAVRAVREHDLVSLDVTESAQDEFTRVCDAKLTKSTFVRGGCASYYLDGQGRAPLPWPWTMGWMRIRLKRFDLSKYRTVRDSAGIVAAPARGAGRPDGAGVKAG